MSDTPIYDELEAIYLNDNLETALRYKDAGWSEFAVLRKDLGHRLKSKLFGRNQDCQGTL